MDFRAAGSTMVIAGVIIGAKFKRANAFKTTFGRQRFNVPFVVRIARFQSNEYLAFKLIATSERCQFIYGSVEKSGQELLISQNVSVLVFDTSPHMGKVKHNF
jgi:hypothetical protein